MLEFAAKLAIGASEHAPHGEAVFFLERALREAEGEGGFVAGGENRIEQAAFLRGHLREAVEPKGVDARERAFAGGIGGKVEKGVGVLEVLIVEPICVVRKNFGKIGKFRAEARVVGDAFGGGLEGGGADVVFAKFAPKIAEFLGEAVAIGRGAVNAQGIAATIEDGAQDHDAALFVEEFGLGLLRDFENELGETLERKNAKARETFDAGHGKYLAFELVSGLARGEQNERRAVGTALQVRGDFSKTSERLATAGGTCEKQRSHQRSQNNFAGGGRKQL